MGKCAPDRFPAGKEIAGKEIRERDWEKIAEKEIALVFFARADLGSQVRPISRGETDFPRGGRSRAIGAGRMLRGNRFGKTDFPRGECSGETDFPRGNRSRNAGRALAQSHATGRLANRPPLPSWHLPRRFAGYLQKVRCIDAILMQLPSGKARRAQCTDAPS